MTEKLNIVQSTTEPDKRNIWLKDNELKKFGAKGWSTIGGSNSGGGNGGTSTDKDALTILVDHGTQTVTVNNKQFLISSSSEGIIEINNKELYNFLFNINMPIFIKAIDNDFQIAGYATCLSTDTEIMLEVYVIDGLLSIVVTNQ